MTNPAPSPFPYLQLLPPPPHPFVTPQVGYLGSNPSTLWPSVCSPNGLLLSPTTPWLQKALGLPGSSLGLRATTKVRKGTEEGARSGPRAADQGSAPSRPSPRSPFSLRPLKPRRAECGGAGSLEKGWTGCPFRTPSPRHFPESPLLARPQPLPVPFRTQSTETRGPLPCRTFQQPAFPPGLVPRRGRGKKVPLHAPRDPGVFPAPPPGPGPCSPAPWRPPGAGGRANTGGARVAGGSRAPQCGPRGVAWGGLAGRGVPARSSRARTQSAEKRRWVGGAAGRAGGDPEARAGGGGRYVPGARR